MKRNDTHINDSYRIDLTFACFLFMIIIQIDISGRLQSCENDVFSGDHLSHPGLGGVIKRETKLNTHSLCVLVSTSYNSFKRKEE